MATDNVQASAIVGSGPTFAGLSDSTEIYVGSCLAFPTAYSPGANTLQYVDATHGLPVAVIGAVSVTGTFFQATQPISAASLPLPAGAATDATLATLSGKVTACNTGAVIIASGSLAANAGTNLNTSALALEAGGNLASINTKTPALGQALAAASIPVVLTAAQITTLTPPTTVTANAGTGTFAVSLATVPALVAGSALIGQVSTFPQSDTLYSGTTALTVLHAAFGVASSGANQLIALTSGKKIKVLSMFCVAQGAVNIYFTDGLEGTVIGGSSNYPIPLPAAGSGFSQAINQFGHFVTSSGNGLYVNLSGAVGISGWISYVLE